MENEFTLEFAKRTKKQAVNTILFCKSPEKSDEAFIIKKQLIRSATSTTANYRASARGRSKAEWFSKIFIVVEDEILKIVSKTRKTAKDNMHNN